MAQGSASSEGTSARWASAAAAASTCSSASAEEEEEEKDKEEEEEEEDIMRDCEGGRSPAGHRACNLSWLSSSHLACFSLRVGPGRAELDNQWPYRYSLKYLYNTTVMIHIDSLSTVYLYGRPR